MSRSAPPAPNDLEALAAFAAGRLDGEERAAVLDRLSVDAEYRELLDELLAFQETETELCAELEEVFDAPEVSGRPGDRDAGEETEEAAGGGSGGRLLPFLPPGFRGLIRTLAALLVLCVGWIVWRQSLPAPADSYTSAIDPGTLAEVEAREPHRILPWTKRGIGGEPEYEEIRRAERGRSFRAGVFAVDLRLAHRDGRAELFLERLERLLLYEDELSLGFAWAEPLDRIRKTMAASPPGEPIPASEAELETALGPLFDEDRVTWPESVRLGAWTRSCWLAAEGGHRDAFTTGPLGGSWAGSPLLRPNLEHLTDEEHQWVLDALDAARAGDLETAGERCWTILRRAGWL